MTVMIMGQVLAKFFHFLPTSLSSCLHIFSYSCLRDTHHFLPQQFLMLFTPCWRNSFLHSWLPWWESVSIFAFGWLLCKNACCSLPSVNRIVKSCDVQEDFWGQVIQISHWLEVPERLIQHIMSESKPQIPGSFSTLW